MMLNFFTSSSILKKFLFFNFIVFFVLSIFTFLYLHEIEPNLVNNRSKQHDKIINNTSNHINRLRTYYNRKLQELKTKFISSSEKVPLLTS